MCLLFVTDEDDQTERVCDTLLMCIITVLNQGLRNGGGVGDILRRPSKEVRRQILHIAKFYSINIGLHDINLISLYYYYYLNHPGTSLCCQSSLRPPVLLCRHYHRTQPHIWCHHRHLCWLEEWETTKGRNPENHLFHLWCVQPCVLQNGARGQSIVGLILIRDYVLQAWKGTNLTTRRFPSKSTSNLNTTCGTTSTSWFWWGWRIQRNTLALRAMWLRWLRSVNLFQYE